MTNVNPTADRPRPGIPRDWTRGALQAAVVLAPIVILIFQAWHHRWIFDDGFINLRVVRQIQAGNGPVFNSGERVEAFTSALWILVLWIGDTLLPVRLEWVAIVLGIGLTIAGVSTAAIGATRLARTLAADAFLIPCGLLIVVAVAPMWYFATSGLEGGLTFAWIGTTFMLMTTWAAGQARVSRTAAIVIGLGWLVRPELVLLSLACVAAILLGSRPLGWRAAVRVMLWMFAIPVAYQVFRMGYYGLLIPNTAIAKEASRARFDRGWTYFRAFADDFRLWIPLVILGAGAYLPMFVYLGRTHERRWLLVSGAFLAGAAATCLYIIRVGGDYIPARLLLPSLFMLATPVAVVGLSRATVVALALPVWAVGSFIWFRPAVPYRTALLLPRNVVTLTTALRSHYSVLIAEYSRPGIYFGGVRLDARPGPAATNHTVDESGIGIISFGLGTDVRVLDWLGLVDPMTAHFEIGDHGLPGHEKPIPGQWARARLTAPGGNVPPAVLEPPALFLPLIPPTTGARFATQVAAVRVVLRCLPLRSLSDSYRKPLTVGRFFSNFGDSLSNTTLRIPPDPETARRRLCSSNPKRAATENNSRTLRPHS